MAPTVKNLGKRFIGKVNNKPSDKRAGGYANGKTRVDTIRKDNS